MSGIVIRHNSSYPEIECKFGVNQYANHHHIHRKWSLSYVIQGTTTTYIGPETEKLWSGGFVAIPGSIPHVCRPHRDNYFSFAVLYLPQKFLSQESNVNHTYSTGSCSVQSFYRIAKIFLTASTEEEINAAVDDLFGLLDTTKKRVSVQGVQFHATPPFDPLNGTGPEGQSRFQIYYHSQKRYGIGTKRIDIIHRIEKAKQLLKQGMSLSAIALDCGFYDQSHFTKTFKQHTGMPPRQYRG